MGIPRKKKIYTNNAHYLNNNIFNLPDYEQNPIPNTKKKAHLQLNKRLLNNTSDQIEEKGDKENVILPTIGQERIFPKINDARTRNQTEKAINRTFDQDTRPVMKQIDKITNVDRDVIDIIGGDLKLNVVTENNFLLGRKGSAPRKDSRNEELKAENFINKEVPRGSRPKSRNNANDDENCRKSQCSQDEQPQRPKSMQRQSTQEDNADEKNQHHHFSNNLRNLKEGLLQKLKNQENLKELYLNQVKKQEEKKKADFDYAIVRTMKEKNEKEKTEQEAKEQIRSQIKQNHFKLLVKQISDNKKTAEGKHEVKRALKQGIDKDIEDHNQFHNEIKEKETELKNFYRKCLANQILEKKASKQPKAEKI